MRYALAEVLPTMARRTPEPISWPNTQQSIERCFRGVDEQTRDQILWGNAASLYGIEG